MDARFYQSEEIDIEQLANDLENMFRMQGYEAQHIGTPDQAVVQLKKGGDLIALIGLQTALTVIIQRMAGGTVTMIGQQKWMDKAAVGAVGLVAAPILWPLMLTAGAGAIRQASLGNQVLNTLDGLVRQRYPDVRLGPIPAQLMPQVQQRWAPPPQYGQSQSVPVYTPSVPVYPPPASTPPAPVYTPSLRCPNCNTPYEPGDTFCSGCGRSLAPQQKTICPNCKFEIKPGVAFCPKCGTSVFQAGSATQAAMPSVASPPPAPTVPSYTPPPAPRPQAPRPATPPPAPYVPPTPQTPPVMPKPSVTMVPGTSKPATPPPTPKKPPVPVYTPPAQTPPPAMPPTPVYVPPTLQTNVTPDAQTLQNPRQPIKAKPSSQPAANTNAPWGKLIFSNGKEVQLSGEQALIGRVDHDVEGITPDVDLSDVPGADTTSRIHATIERVGSTYMVTDLNSTNATRVNGKRLEPDKASPINDGESLEFGKVKCTFKKL
ncbi:MAG TPA: zinc-ribbon domain-containing protein [Ktedonobacteraceae bacterium]|nr:zinc-ribbon domain-containing protein [Ktedonobacteraceae bacterium]